MKLTSDGTPVFKSCDLITQVYNGFDLRKVDFLADLSSEDIQKYNQYASDFDFPHLLGEMDKSGEEIWFMPDEYRNMDIYDWLIKHCHDEASYRRRLNDECIYFIEHGWDMVLKWLKYFIDTCKERDIITGVGRGSSVSSYALYVIGVHQIDPVLYDIDYRDFLRG